MQNETVKRALAEVSTDVLNFYTPNDTKLSSYRHFVLCIDGRHGDRIRGSFIHDLLRNRRFLFYKTHLIQEVSLSCEIGHNSSIAK